MDRPKERDTIDLRELRTSVDDYLAFIESDEYHEDRVDDYENDIFEKAIELFYPDLEIWDWINTRHE